MPEDWGTDGLTRRQLVMTGVALSAGAALPSIARSAGKPRWRVRATKPGYGSARTAVRVLRNRPRFTG